jgi:TM2 domain-containing membrane protein YozV
MAEIVDIQGSTVKIGDDGQIISVPIAALAFANPVIGDEVKVYKDAESIIVRKANNTRPFAGGQSDKSKLTAGLLSIFLGIFGVGNFYRGHIGKGVAQLLITLLAGWFFGLGIFITSIWGLIEGIVIISSKPGSRDHQDGDGRELID